MEKCNNCGEVKVISIPDELCRECEIALFG